MATVNDYLTSITPEQRMHYERIKAVVLRLVPDAEETISYGMPTFKYREKPLLYFGAFKNHMSVFPTPQPVLDMQTQGKLTEFKVSKGTVQFTTDKPLPEEILEQMIQLRKVQIG